MCRWLAYSGSPVRPEWLLYRTTHGLIGQSLAAREMDHPINGDGFGMGLYGTAQVELATSAVRQEASQAERPSPSTRSCGCWPVMLDHASSLRVRLAGMTDCSRIRAFEALSVPGSFAV
jgi:hypothetical protein